MFGVGGARLTYLIAAAAGMFPAVAWPQDFPSKPVRYIVPLGPGGSPDIVGRLIADRRASKSLGTSCTHRTATSAGRLELIPSNHCRGVRTAPVSKCAT